MLRRSAVLNSGKNIFPSNIQGLPTWYEVRICEAGHLGARGGTDLMIAMNPQTWDKDVAEIEPGGYLFYDSTKPLPPTASAGCTVTVSRPGSMRRHPTATRTTGPDVRVAPAPSVPGGGGGACSVLTAFDISTICCSIRPNRTVKAAMDSLMPWTSDVN